MWDNLSKALFVVRVVVRVVYVGLVCFICVDTGSGFCDSLLLACRPGEFIDLQTHLCVGVPAVIKLALCSGYAGHRTKRSQPVHSGGPAPGTIEGSTQE